VGDGGKVGTRTTCCAVTAKGRRCRKLLKSDLRGFERGGRGVRYRSFQARGQRIEGARLDGEEITDSIDLCPAAVRCREADKRKIYDKKTEAQYV